MIYGKIHAQRTGAWEKAMQKNAVLDKAEFEQLLQPYRISQLLIQPS